MTKSLGTPVLPFVNIDDSNRSHLVWMRSNSGTVNDPDLSLESVKISSTGALTLPVEIAKSSRSFGLINIATVSYSQNAAGVVPWHFWSHLQILHQS